MKKILASTICMCVLLGTLTGCTGTNSNSISDSGKRNNSSNRSSDPLNLESQICTDNFLTYELEDGTSIRSSVEIFEIIDSRTTDDHDSSNVRIVLR